MTCLCLALLPRTAAADSLADRGVVKDLIAIGALEISESGRPALTKNISRAEFVSLVMSYKYPDAAGNTGCFDELDPDLRPGFDYHLLFGDVSVMASYAPELCTAMLVGVINGYPDGTFRPDRPINFAEAAKVINHVFNLDYIMPDYEHQVWYASYVANLYEHKAVPESIETYDQNINQAEANYMVFKVNSKSDLSESG